MDGESLFRDVVDKYSRHINPQLAKLMSFAGFGVEVRAEGCMIYDHEGRGFIDCLGGYGTFILGHRHPAVVQAVKDQLDQIALSGKAFFSAPAADLAARLAEVTPDGLEYSFFNNSGAEAVEAALKFARSSTGRTKFVSTYGSYHGKTMGALSVTGREKYQKPFAPLLDGVTFVPFGDFDALSAALDTETAAFIVEPVQGEGGIIVPPDGYLQHAREATAKVGALLIADEVQSGLGRTGRNFAVEWEGVSPDLMCLAKGMGGGVMPLGATIGTAQIFNRVFGTNPIAHSSTFGGNPLACAAGLAGLNVLIEQNLASRSECYGTYMMSKFEAIAAKYPEMISEVRGRGLMIGLEFSMDEVGELVVAQFMKRGVCVAYALNNPRVLRFEPPLIIEQEQIDHVCTALDESLAETTELLADLV